HTIGAGGGSLAWIDEAGLPQVGPESAGANPGPVCYGLGGDVPAVTDANLLLGRIPATAKLGGSMSLDRLAAGRAFAAYGEEIGLSAEAAAQAVIRIAEEHMSAALRVVSVQRGYDPADFTLLCFGGAGGLHACAVAENLGMGRVVFPVASGAFSAMGMLAGRQQSEFSRTRCMLLDDESTVERLSTLFEELESEAVAAMQGLPLNFEPRVDMRYAGQGFHISIDLQPGDMDNLQHHLLQRFEQAHIQAYGHSLNRPIELMTARLTAVVEQQAISFPPLVSVSQARPVGYSEVYGVGEVPLYQRELLPAGFTCSGPALIVESTSTLWLNGNWQVRVDPFGHLLLELL
ncbi:MAG: methylhydantoinase, partial [Zetaproteobacteria bacterium CG_4_9_14_3_um_filter_53_7]